MNTTPKLMNFSRMRDIFESQATNIREHLTMNRELAILHGNPQVLRLIIQQQPPFLIDDHRMGIILRGQICANINLVEKKIGPGTLVFIGPGSILSPISISPDLEIYGFGLSAEFPMPFPPGQMPTAFNGNLRDFQLPVSDADIATARHIVDTLWHVVRQKDYNRQTVSSLVAAQMHHYDGLYRQHHDRLQSSMTREQTVFDRFIYLVNQNAIREHHINFYAERMCLTERHLGTVVRQTSGITAKQWIDRAIITRIKVELKHTDKSIAQISDEMRFPTPSFFCKYFKRLTGQTPQIFRQKD
ncbi:MAG: AraC family transcriptional regulator [Prevotella sp.]|nr:AraC family transcriptional regulator [Prevotella sp.]